MNLSGGGSWTARAGLTMCIQCQHRAARVRFRHRTRRQHRMRCQRRMRCRHRLKQNRDPHRQRSNRHPSLTLHQSEAGRAKTTCFRARWVAAHRALCRRRNGCTRARSRLQSRWSAASRTTPDVASWVSDSLVLSQLVTGGTSPFPRPAGGAVGAPPLHEVRFAHATRSAYPDRTLGAMY
jgi:hypothetical protein